MPYRLIELTASLDQLKEARELINEEEAVQLWTDKIDDGNGILRVLLPVEYSEKMMDDLTERFGDSEGFRLMLFSIEATLPRPEEPKEKNRTDKENQIRVSDKKFETTKALKGRHIVGNDIIMFLGKI